MLLKVLDHEFFHATPEARSLPETFATYLHFLCLPLESVGRAFRAHITTRFASEFADIVDVRQMTRQAPPLFELSVTIGFRARVPLYPNIVAM